MQQECFVIIAQHKLYSALLFRHKSKRELLCYWKFRNKLWNRLYRYLFIFFPFFVIPTNPTRNWNEKKKSESWSVVATDSELGLKTLIGYVLSKLLPMLFAGYYLCVLFCLSVCLSVTVCTLCKHNLQCLIYIFLGKCNLRADTTIVWLLRLVVEMWPTFQHLEAF